MTLKFYTESTATNPHWTNVITRHIPHTPCDTPEEADFIVSTRIPYGSIDVQLIQTVLHSYRDIAHRILVFLLSDYNEPLDVPSNVLLFRAGMYRSHKKPNEYLIPYVWVKEELQGEDDSPPLPKQTHRPIIGFCGSITSHPCRIQHINQVKRAPDLKANFILRTDHWAGRPHDSQVVQQFVKNIRESHFTLCSRGAGNWSARFYQVLALGRIPVVVQTDMILPWEEHIPWQHIIVLCPQEQDIAPRIRQVWNTRNLVEMQRQCRRIYEEYLAPEAWGRRIAAEILQPLL
jgi:hypothetical protein